MAALVGAELSLPWGQERLVSLDFGRDVALGNRGKHSVPPLWSEPDKGSECHQHRLPGCHFDQGIVRKEAKTINKSTSIKKKKST